MLRQTRFRRGVVVACHAALLAGVSHANQVTDWNEKLVEVMLAEKTAPPMQSRNAAIVHVAVFEAVNAIDPRYVSYGATIETVKGASAEAAAAGAAHAALVALYPGQATALNELLAKTTKPIAEGPGKREGVAIGQRAAQAILALRASDGFDAQGAYSRPNTPDAWIPNPGIPPMGVRWGEVKPWALKTGSQFRPARPPEITSEQFKRDYREVMELGGKASPRRTAEQTQIAAFWIPPGVPMWSPVARQLTDARRLSLVDSARTFALLSIAAADAIIACWDAKYAYANFRPITAIRGGVGGTDLSPDANWEPAVATPPFPAYVSGHACFGGAAQTVLESTFGNGEVAVTIRSHSVPGYERKYKRLQEISDEASNARIWGGIHWRTDQTEGEVLGRKVGNHAITQVLRPR